MLETLFAFLFGVIIGSFLNVIILRYNTGTGIGGRSRCMSCAKTLAWYELVPVVSYVVQRGRCRGCFTSLSVQYAVVELLCGGLFAATWALGLSPAYTFCAWLAIALLLVIAVYDARHTIIPDGPVYALIVLGIARILLASSDPLLDLFTGFFWAALFTLIWLGSKGEWMGFGDAKLVLAFGWLLPYPFNITSVIIGFWAGALWALGILLLEKLLARKARRKLLSTHIPFAPFLVFGAFITFLFQIRLW